MGRWAFDSDKPGESMDEGHFDSDTATKGSLWRVTIDGKVLGIIPGSRIREGR